MANANRFLLKQFAGQAGNNGVFGSGQQGQGVIATSIEQVQSLNSFEQGWNSATITADKLPCLEEFQGVSALAYKAIKELYSEGIPQWLSTETYYKDTFVVYNGKLYVNTTGSYTTNNPAIDTTNWSDYSDVVKNALNDYFVRTTGNQDIDGVKTFLKKIWSYTDDYNDSRRVCVLRTYTLGDTDEVVQIAGTDVVDKNGIEIAQNLIIKEQGGIVRNGQWMKSLIPGSNVTVWGCMTEARPDGTFGTYAINPPADANDTSIATTSWVRANAGGGVPVGTILPYGGTTAPAGFLLCNGGAISRTTYANLFSVIGTAYGAGDGYTTFNLPNKTDFIIDTKETATGFYIVYSNGYYEETGKAFNIQPSTWINISLSKTMKNTKYSLTGSGVDPGIPSSFPDQFFAYKSPLRVDGFTAGIRYLSEGQVFEDRGFSWKVSGFLAAGQYNSNYKQIIKY